MRIMNKIIAICVALCFFVSCSDDDAILPELKSSGLEENQNQLQLGKSLALTPSLNTKDVDYQWKINNEVVSNEATLLFNPDKIGNYTIHFSATNSSGTAECTYDIEVIKLRDKVENSSAYLTTLLEYKPAPGQYINEEIGLPENAEQIVGEPSSNLLTLGGFGGYVIAGFDHTIMNTEGKDFQVYANSFDGSSEAGIVMVMFDLNGNDKADDEWYELKGSAHDDPQTIRNYTITYTNPKGTADVPWTDNQGNSGVVKQNSYHVHNYYPEFIAEQDQITFTGTLLPNKKGTNDKGWIVIDEFDYGYVDNYSEEYPSNKANQFDINWAIDKDGKSVTLPGIDFVKIYTAVNIDAGILGEVSTEIKGAADLSMLN
ncbi:PKD domain-containing protein [Puteibacter caeruleilacunae]|nr:PKD domain-containing protein [Puteibacter caeruleilacunae]